MTRPLEQQQQQQPHHKQQQHSLKEADLIAFESAAAGHEGVMSDASGSLIIKPCTAAEIAFYESALTHPDLAAYMPTFMGTLSLGPPPNEVSEEVLAAASQSLTNAIPVGVPASTSSAALADSEPETTAATVAAVADAVASSNATITTGAFPISPSPDAPSQSPPTPLRLHGKKLDTGLSIVLANATAGFKHPTVLDVKLGARLWDDDARPEKRARLDQVSGETTSGSLGFRIAGMKIWRGDNVASSSDTNVSTGKVQDVVDGHSRKRAKQETENKSERQPAAEIDTGIKSDADGYQTYDKLYGRSFKAENVHEGFREYFKLSRDPTTTSATPPNSSKSPFPGPGPFHALPGLFDAQLAGLQSVLENEECRLYSASILLVYEGDAEALQAASIYENERKKERAYSNARREKMKDIRAGSVVVETPNGSYEDVGEVAIAAAAPRPMSEEAYEDGEGEAIFATDSDEDSFYDDEDEGPKTLTLKLIDFAHARFVPGEGADENVLRGIRSVRDILNGLRC